MWYSGTHIDKVYIDGSSFELLIRRSIDKSDIQKIPGFIRTANIAIWKFYEPTVLMEDHTLVSCLYKSGSHDPLLSNTGLR